MKIDHIGYAVKNIIKARDSFESIGYSFEQLIEDEFRNSMLLFGEKDGYRIELVSPLDKKKESPVDQYLRNTFGTPYHICYISDNFENDIEKLTNMGFRIVIEPCPAVAFNGKRVVFLLSIGFGLMEIVEE